MSIAELTRWLLLGLMTEEDIEKEWVYQPSMNYEKLTQFIRAAEEYSKGDSIREVEYLEIRLPLVIREKCTQIANHKYYIEMEKITDEKVISIIKSNTLDVRPTEEYARRLMEHLGAQRFTIRDIP